MILAVQRIVGKLADWNAKAYKVASQICVLVVVLVVITILCYVFSIIVLLVVIAFIFGWLTHACDH